MYVCTHTEDLNSYLDPAHTHAQGQTIILTDAHLCVPSSRALTAARRPRAPGCSASRPRRLPSGNFGQNSPSLESAPKVAAKQNFKCDCYKVRNLASPHLDLRVDKVALNPRDAFQIPAPFDPKFTSGHHIGSGSSPAAKKRKMSAEALSRRNLRKGSASRAEVLILSSEGGWGGGRYPRWRGSAARNLG